MGTTMRLPDVDVPAGGEIERALLVAVGGPEEAEFLGVDALLPLLERRRGGEAGVSAVSAVAGPELWRDARASRLLEGLLGAALSRSDTPQGDAVLDGRTQDLVGLGLVPGLARDPVLYSIEHADGAASALLRLDGVVADASFAVKTRADGIVSAKIHLPPGAAAHHWSTLAERLDGYFADGHLPWPPSRARLAAGLLARLREARGRPGTTIATPELVRSGG
jgi:hypothetical protein